jgi:hypothetical protein
MDTVNMATTAITPKAIKIVDFPSVIVLSQFKVTSKYHARNDVQCRSTLLERKNSEFFVRKPLAKKNGASRALPERFSADLTVVLKDSEAEKRAVLLFILFSDMLDRFFHGF